MTMDGSLFSGALGAMLIEILPFLRGIGSDIRRTIGEDIPALIPLSWVPMALRIFSLASSSKHWSVFKPGRLVSSIQSSARMSISCAYQNAD